MQDFVVFLPKPDSTTEATHQTDSVMVRDWQAQYPNHAEFSFYSGCILMVDLALQCFDHVRRVRSESAYQGFWDVHYTLIKEMKVRRSALRKHLDPASVRRDPLAFSLHMNLCATEICFHDAAISQIKGQGLPDELSSESRKSSTAAALRIAAAVKMTWPTSDGQADLLALQATFTAWPLVMAIGVLSRDLGLSPRDLNVSESSANSLHLLFAALDRVEHVEGYWHGETRVAKDILGSLGNEAL